MSASCSIDSKKAFQACSSSPPEARIHCMAVCVMLVRYASIGLLPEDNQAHLTSLAILHDVQAEESDWPRYQTGELGPLADGMMRELTELGYFTRPHRTRLS